MAPPIDQLLKSATTLKAERLILEAGKNAFVCTNTGIKELTRTQLAHYDIFMLLSPIMPGDNEMALARRRHRRCRPRHRRRREQAPGRAR